jgi:hypothetical protein
MYIRLLLYGVFLVSCSSQANRPCETRIAESHPRSQIPEADHGAPGPPARSTADPALLDFRIEPWPAGRSTGTGFDPDGGQRPVTMQENRIRLRLRNKGSNRLWINSSMTTCSSGSGCDVTLEIINSSTGKTLASDLCRAFEMPPDYTALPPEGEIATTAGLKCFDFSGSGPWRITARYQDRNARRADLVAKVPVPPLGAEWFAGSVHSNSIEILAVPLFPEKSVETGGPTKRP